MGQAKQRGTRDERIAAASPRTPKPDRRYRYYMPLSTAALDYLWQRYKVGKNDETVAEIIAKARADKEKRDAAAVQAG